MSATEDPSLEPPRDAVKEAPALQKGQPTGRGWARLLEGWELGAITVGLVLTAALLVVPRAAKPGLFPVPLVDVQETLTWRARVAELAARAEREGLPFEARAVGDAVRRFGTALATGGDVGHVRRLLDERVLVVRGAGQLAALLRLQAVQARLFVRAVREHAFGQPPSAELAALGGDFVARATTNGWLGPEGCVADDDELLTLFNMRWLELTALRDEPSFRPTLAEYRRYFRFLLLHPERSTNGDASEQERARRRLRYVEALAHKDTEYPLALARGTLLGQLGAAPESAQALSRHLAKSQNERWTLRARNYLIFAAQGRTDEAATPE
jgi:hypothetical protein